MAKVIKNNFGNFLIFCLIFLIITGWIFSGWPQIWQNPSVPPEVQEVQAATETLRPNAAGDETVLNQYPSSTENWDKVDEVDPDEGTTRVQRWQYSYARDLYNLPAHTGSGTINFIKIYFRCYRGALSEQSYAKPSLKSDSTVTDGTEVALTTSWTTYSQQWNTNPATVSDSWTWDDIDALQVGVSLKGSIDYEDAYCTQVYVEVEYNVETLRPNAAGDETNLNNQYPASGAHWDKVDEAVADDGGTYVGNNNDYNNYQRDLYNLPASGGTGTINSITVYARCYNIQAGASGLMLKIAVKSNSTVTESAEKTVTNNWEAQSQQWNTNPADSLAWEWADIDALQIGIALKAYNYIGSARVTQCTQVYVEVDYTPNQAPSVSSVSLNNGNNITLTENTTILVSATGTVSDANTYSDISSVTGGIYRSGVSGAENCSPDDNNCYTAAFATSSCSGDDCLATGNFNIQFFAEPTDNGTYATAQGWDTQKWVAWIKAIDSANASSTATNSAQTVDVNTLAALVVDSSITYDALDPGQNMSNLTKQLNATTTGNVPIDIQIKGDDMIYGATGTVAVANQRYATSSVAWASGNTASSTYVNFEVEMSKPTTSPSNSTDIIYWGWQVPSGKPAGTYTGINYFNAVED